MNTFHHQFQAFYAMLFLFLTNRYATVSASDPEEEGLIYLKDHATKPDVTVLPSGLQYRVLRKGDGVYHPKLGTRCSCHYVGRLLDGTVFDSSYDRGSPTTFAPNQVIKGWTEAMQLMVEGDLWELTIPSDLAYGDHGSPPKIPGHSVLVFEMEILEILGDDDNDKILAIKSNPLTKELCSEKEIHYMEQKAGHWTPEKRQTELSRLKIMAAGKMKPALAQWIQRRVNILQKLVDGEGNTEEL